MIETYFSEYLSRDNAARLIDESKTMFPHVDFLFLRKVKIDASARSGISRLVKNLPANYANAVVREYVTNHYLNSGETLFGVNEDGRIGHEQGKGLPREEFYIHFRSENSGRSILKTSPSHTTIDDYFTRKRGIVGRIDASGDRYDVMVHQAVGTSGLTVADMRALNVRAKIFAEFLRELSPPQRDRLYA